MSQEWRTKKHQKVYEGKIIKVWEDQVVTPNGKETIYSNVERKHSILVIALNEQGEFQLVRQYRYQVRQESWEFPAGTINQGEDPTEAARRELKEEIGMTAEKLQLLGQISTNASLDTQ